MTLFTFISIFIFLNFQISYKKYWGFNWKGIRPEIKDSVLEFQSHPFPIGKYIEYKGEMNDIVKSKKWILENANETELILLKKYPNPYIRLVAYDGLLQRKNYNTFVLLNEILDDTLAVLPEQNGCIGNYIFISEYFMKNIFYIDTSYHKNINLNYKNYKLSDNDILKLQSKYYSILGRKHKIMQKLFEKGEI